MNKYGIVKIQFDKCLNPDCNNMIRHTPCMIKNKTYLTCSLSCAAVLRKHPSKYTPEAISWIKDNFDTMTTKEIADHFNTTVSGFKRSMSYFRKKGIDIPRRQRKISTQKVAKAPKIRKALNIKSVSNKKPAEPVVVKPKKKEKVFSTISRPLAGLICVKINDKTNVYVSSESEVEKVRKKYQYLNERSW